MSKSLVALFSLLLLGHLLCAQVSNECATAVPICNNTPVNGGTDGYGNDDFNGAATSGCLEQTTTGAIESNSAWYRFRTGASGQLGFNIGHDTAEDWDFALYQTNDCNNLGDPVRCNFFDNSDQRAYTGVGEDPTGVQSVNYEDWLYVEPGQDYYLLINNFSNLNTGFSIQFSGEIFVTNPNDALDCSIISNLLGPPIAACENDMIVLDATTNNANAYTWYADTGTGFQILTGENNATLQVSTDALYRVEVSTPTETIISDVQVAFTASPVTEALSDEIFCHNENMVYDLEQKDIEALGSQNGDEIMVSYHSTQADADNGVNALPKTYAKNPGGETIFVRTTSMANPDCFDSSENFDLYAIEEPSASFDTEAFLCDNATSVTIGETSPNPNYTYQWSSGETTASLDVSQSGDYALTITNSYNGVQCAINRTVSVITSDSPRIDAIEIDDLQSNNQVTVISEAVGDFEYSLDDGAFQASNTFEGVLPGAHTLTMRDRNGCGSVTESIVVVGFLNHFSPNGDGLNENWHIEELSSLNDPLVTIFDRYGKLITQLNEFSPGWDGTFEGRPLPATDYWFKLSYVDQDGTRTYAKYLQNHFSLRR